MWVRGYSMYVCQLANAPNGMDLAMHPVMVPWPWPCTSTVLNVLQLLLVANAEAESAHLAFKLIKGENEEHNGRRPSA